VNIILICWLRIGKKSAFGEQDFQDEKLTLNQLFLAPLLIRGANNFLNGPRKPGCF
jgi:hypothetical protein